MFIFLLFGCNSQGCHRYNAEIHTIDSIYKKENDSLRGQSRYEDLINVDFALIMNSQKINYKKGIVKGYIDIGNLLLNLKRNKESIRYLNEASKYISDIQDIEVKSRLYIELGKNYGALGILKISREFYFNALEAEKLIGDSIVRRKITAYTYGCIAAAYQDDSLNIDSLRFYFLKAYQTIPDLFNTTKVAQFYTDYKINLDSAFYYLNKCEPLYNSVGAAPYQKGIYLRVRGYYYYLNNNYTNAIAYLKESLDIFTQISRPQDILQSYRLLSSFYENVDQNERVFYLEKYTKLNDSLSQEEKQVLSLPIDNILKAHEQSLKKEKHTVILYSTVIVIVLIAVGVFFYIKARKKDIASQELLIQKDEEQNELKLKVNDAFEEVLDKAKSNDLNFYTRFKEVYPNVHSGLLKVNSDLQLSELTLCAYIYLDFQTKEIAEATFRSIKTIQNRKYQLRKRLNISSSEDLYVWFKNIK